MSKSSFIASGFGAIVLLVAAGIASSSGAPKPGYLAKIGPGPLRLQPARPVVHTVNLPPLAMQDATATEASLPSVSPSEDITYRARSPFSMMSLPLKFFMPSSLWINDYSRMDVNDSPQPQPAAQETNPAPIPPAASDVLTISPRMLVEYFKPQSQTNAANASALAPMSFTPVIPGGPGTGGTGTMP
jgi:hypothetical protein